MILDFAGAKTLAKEKTLKQTGDTSKKITNNRKCLFLSTGCVLPTKNARCGSMVGFMKQKACPRNSVKPCKAQTAICFKGFKWWITVGQLGYFSQSQSPSGTLKFNPAHRTKCKMGEQFQVGWVGAAPRSLYGDCSDESEAQPVDCELNSGEASLASPCQAKQQKNAKVT